MANGNASSTPGGCWVLFGVMLVVGAIVAAAISLAALVDPFDWMPSVSQIWADCDGDCALAQRFPGFWWHTVANLAYAAVTPVAAIMFAGSVADLRTRRGARYDSATAMEEFGDARRAFNTAGAVLGVLALLPLIVAIA